jgi:hypothetical protein
MPNWPAIIRYRGEGELAFVENFQQWQHDPDLSEFVYQDGDVLIDSQGYFYLPQYDENTGSVELLASGERLPLQEFCGLVQMHLGALGQCCISKLDLASYEEGFRLIEQTLGH